ncbi:hypothetical protein B0H10DRAFT_1211737 [Mycena sp. CBHHK59/15]|nr:hypothetical protein B0H10DRAFT_1211737 [Mycena sp. CBHHK59/15]
MHPAPSHAEETFVPRIFRDRIAKLVRAFENRIRGMRRERRGLNKRLSEYAYPVLTLPNEITSEIFLNFLPPYPDRPPSTGLLSPILLGQVCRQWREVAFSTPSLWRAMQLELGDDKYYNQSKLHLLKEWLDRSRDCPLSISLIYSPSTGLRPSLPAFIQTILLHRSRWEYVQLKLTFDDLRQIQGEMPFLRHLTVGFDTFPSEVSPGIAEFPPITVFQEAPRLSTIVLDQQFLPSAMRLPWAQLTTIVSYSLYPYECAEILCNAVKLIDVTFTIHLSEDDILSEVPPLMHLRSLVLRNGDSDGAQGAQMQLLGVLTLPALRRLEIFDEGFDPDSRATLVSLIARSKCLLEELSITKARISESLYREAFPSVAKLKVAPRRASFPIPLEAMEEPF